MKLSSPRQREPSISGKSNLQDAQRNVVILAGALRSGTTLLRLILDGHSNISCPGEFDFVVDAVQHVGTRQPIERYLEYLESNRIFREYAFNVMSKGSYADLVHDLCGQVRGDAGHLVLPIHRNFQHTATLFPNAKFVHLIRDPRDVAYSVMQMGWAGNVWHGVKPWLDTETQWRCFANELDSNRVISVRFEDAVSKPEATLRRICKFLDVPYEVTMLDVESRSTYQRPDGAYASKWRDRTAERAHREVELIEARIEPLLSELGYQPEYQQPRAPGIVDRMKLSANDRFGRFRFHADRYGLSTVIGEKVCRWMALHELHSTIRQRIDRIDSTYLK